MSDPTAPEPTMEEILASIRRIISEDDKPAEAAEPAAVEPVAHTPAPPPPPAPEPEPHVPAPEPAAAHHPAAFEEEEVLELTEPAPAHPETHGDLEVFTPKVEPHAPAPQAPEPQPQPLARPARSPAYEEVDEAALLSGGAEDAVLSHFGRLSQTIAMPKSARTLEDVVRELLRPLLSDWLDEHLPRIVEEKVQAEVERIARRRP